MENTTYTTDQRIQRAIKALEILMKSKTRWTKKDHRMIAIAHSALKATQKEGE